MTGDSMIFAAIAAAATLAVLGFVLHPVWRVPSARVPAAGLVGGLALAAFLLYRMVGTPAALDPAARAAPATLEGAIAQLETRLQADPSQLEGWRLLGQAYAGAKQPAKAADAFAHAAKLAPDDADVLVEAAESRALAAPEHRIDAQGVAWLDHALQVQPTHQRARWFSGIAKRQAGDAAGSAAVWASLLPEVDPNAAAVLREQIDAARADAGLPPLPAAATAAATSATAQAATSSAAPGPHAIQVRVALDRDLAARARLDGNATVFVIARAGRPADADRGRTPRRFRVAVHRHARRRRRPDADREAVGRRRGRAGRAHLAQRQRHAAGRRPRIRAGARTPARERAGGTPRRPGPMRDLR